MERRLASVTLDTLGELPRPCRECVFWELDPVAGQDAQESGDPGLEKEAWLSQTLLEWGSCGKLVYVDGAPAGYVLYAPPAYLPRSGAFPTSPVSADAVLLTTAHVVPGYTGAGLGRMLVQAAARDLARRGFRAIEAFGRTRLTEPAEPIEPGATRELAEPDPAGVPAGRCVAPADFFLAVGFKTVAPHRRYPRLRLELRTGPAMPAEVGQAELDQALDTLLTSMSSEPGLHRAVPVQAPVAGLPAGLPFPPAPDSSARSADTSIDPVATSASSG